MKKSHIALILVLVFAVTPVLSVGASPATRQRRDELYQQLQNVRQDMREQQNLLAGTRHEMSQIMAQMQELDRKMMDAATALEGIELSLFDTEIRIADTEETIETTRVEYALQLEVFRTRVRAIHEDGSVGFLNVLFQAESITDFLARWEYLRVIAEFDRDLLERLEQTKTYYASHREDLARWVILMEELQFQYILTLDDLEFIYAERKEWFNSLAENEELLAELLAIAEHEQSMVESAFNVINAQLQREENELARQRAQQQHNERLARLNNFDGQFQWPIPTHFRISSGFGMRFHPILRTNRIHQGIDVPAPTGTRLIAAAAGYVRFAGWSGGYGNTVIIDHGNGYSTLYAHNSRNRVTTGQFVQRGDHIADVGSTGMSTGPHLHFEVRINNSAVDPMRYFPD